MAMGVSTQALQTWDLVNVKKQGAQGSRVYYDIREVIQLRLKRDVDKGTAAQSLPQQRTRLAKNQADKAELEVKKLKGELIPAEDIEKHWENMFLAFRAKILAIPQKAAMVALNATSIEDVEESLSLFLVEALQELAGDGMPDEYKADRQESTFNSKATTETDGEHVGGQL